MVRIKLENFGTAKRSTAGPALAGSDSEKSGVSAVTDAVFNAPGSLAKGAMVVGAYIHVCKRCTAMMPSESCSTPPALANPVCMCRWCCWRWRR